MKLERPHKRFVSVYTWGPLGLIARRGVSVRNGYWDPNATYTAPEESWQCGYGDPPPDELQAYLVERMQTGSFNWRGGEGSVTDRVTQDMQDSETGELRWSAYTRPSIGLIYMGARYYLPEAGRWTQPDPVALGWRLPEGRMTGGRIARMMR